MKILFRHSSDGAGFSDTFGRLDVVMKYLYQFLIIIGFSFAGEMIHAALPLPVPASVYGLVLLFVCLMLGIVRLNQIEAAADFFLQIMPVLFVGASVSLMNIIQDILGSLAAILIITVVSTFVVMGVTGKTAQYIIDKKEKGRR